MKIGVVVISQTGNTLAVAQELAEKLAASGHSVGIERLRPIGEVSSATREYRFEALPDLGKYEALVLGSSVMAFSLSPAMASYLSRIGGLEGKSVALLVTELFPFSWMGGNQAVRAMRRACESRGARVRGAGIVHWSSRRREEQIRRVVDSLGALF